jgi:hypothetical protein
MVPLGPARAGTVKHATAVARLVAMAALRNRPRVDEKLDLLFITVSAWVNGTNVVTTNGCAKANRGAIREDKTREEQKNHFIRVYALCA